MKNYLLCCLFLICLVSCNKDKPTVKVPDKPTEIPGNSVKGGVFIVNEGNFQWGNASWSYFNLSDSSITPDLFKTANGRPLGDVFQSMEIVDKTAYLVVNNSGKVEVVNAEDGKSKASITGLKSPRYLLPFLQKAYVTDYSGNAISVIDLNQNKLIKTIPCMGWTEELLLSNGKIFITNVESHYLYVLNPETDAISDSIKVGFGSNSIRRDKNGKLWVLCGGSSSKNIPGSLYRINPADNKVEAFFPFMKATQNPFKLRINGKGDKLYFIENGIQQFSIDASTLPASALISASGTNFWGLGIQSKTGHIYVADAIDYVQKGKVLIYSENGTLLYSFNAGSIPGDFYFY
jgi:DNA-binding beta-propeller fold protein YncE